MPVCVPVCDGDSVPVPVAVLLLELVPVLLEDGVPVTVAEDDGAIVALVLGLAPVERLAVAEVVLVAVMLLVAETVAVPV